jgi:type II secretory pathway pseudopilin PulG
MIPGRGGCELAVLAVLGVLTIFLFPAMQGPYSVVNGPATALQAARVAARLQTAIVQDACRSLGNCRISSLAVLSWMSLPEADFQTVALPACSTILRC